MDLQVGIDGQYIFDGGENIRGGIIDVEVVKCAIAGRVVESVGWVKMGNFRAVTQGGEMSLPEAEKSDAPSGTRK